MFQLHISFYCLVGVLLHKYTTVCRIYSPDDRHLHCFYYGLLLIKAAMNRQVKVYLWICVRFFWIINNGITSYNKCTFNFTKTCKIVFQSSSTILHSHQHLRAPVAPHPFGYLSVSLILAMLVGVKCYPS